MTNQKLFALICIAVSLAATARAAAAQAADTTKDQAGAATQRAGYPSNATSPAPAMASVCTVTPDTSATASDKSGKGAKPGGGTDSAANGSGGGSGIGPSQAPSVQVTVNTAAAASNGRQMPDGVTKSTSFATMVLPLPEGGTNAAQLASRLSGFSKSVVSATALSPSTIVVAIDASTKEVNVEDIKDQLQGYVNEAAQSDPNVFAVVLPAGTGKACDVAHALINAIPGILSITAVDDTRLLVTADASTALPSPELVALVGSAVDAWNIHLQLDTLRHQPGPDTQKDVGPLAAALHIGLIPNTRLGVQLREILLRLPAAPANPGYKDRQQLIEILRDADESLESRVKGLAAELATPTVPTTPKVETLVQRLYYFHDPVAVAKLISDAYPNVQAQAIQPDTVVLSDPADLDDDARHNALKSAQRTIARLDQPRPQVQVDAWNLQLSTTDDNKLGIVIPKLEDLAGNYNAAINRSVQLGWTYLSQRISSPGSLDPMLLDYLTLTTSVNQNGIVERVDSSGMVHGGVPEAGYGLGFTSLYYPLTPNLLDMLVTLASLNTPHSATEEMLNRMEGPGPHFHGQSTPCRQRDIDNYRISETEDRASRARIRPEMYLQLECTYDALQYGLFSQPPAWPPIAAAEQAHATSALGQLRAALADFLFHYKRMVEYPDDFHSYLEPIAADTLDSAFQPSVEAFNEDLSVFQSRLQIQIAATLEDPMLRSGLKYGYGGLVSVKVLGNQLGSVTTATQNYFDATPAPTLNDLFANLQTEGASVQKSPLSSLVTSLAPAKAVELLTVLGQTLTPKATTAHLGRGLDLAVTAHTLSGAYGADLDLSVQSTENGAGLVQAGSSTTSDDLNSRVSQHTVDTHVRVDSLKLFKVSTLSAVLARGQAPWKPIDPLFEVPALGLLIKRPLKPKEVYTQSLVFVDAMIVPTAADLGFGVPMVDDQIQLENGRYRELKSLEAFPDYLGYRILQYHQRVVDCLSREYIDQTGEVRVWVNGAPGQPGHAQPGCFMNVAHNLADYPAVRN